MNVKDVRISPGLNQAVWSRGIKSPPKRIRVRLERKRNDDEGAKEKLYVVASVVAGVANFKVSAADIRQSTAIVHPLQRLAADPFRVCRQRLSRATSRL